MGPACLRREDWVSWVPLLPGRSAGQGGGREGGAVILQSRGWSQLGTLSAGCGWDAWLCCREWVWRGRCQLQPDCQRCLLDTLAPRHTAQLRREADPGPWTSPYPAAGYRKACSPHLQARHTHEEVTATGREPTGGTTARLKHGESGNAER